MIAPTISYKPVTRYTRAGYNGKWIKCPKCSQTSKVYHFSFSSLVCMCCRESVEKYDWLVETKGVA